MIAILALLFLMVWFIIMFRLMNSIDKDVNRTLELDKCDKMHAWAYDKDGYLYCTRCKKKPFEEQ